MKVRHHEIIDHLANRARMRKSHVVSFLEGQPGAARAAHHRPGAPARAHRRRDPVDGGVRRRRDPARLGRDLAAEGRAARGARLRLGLAPHARQAHDGAARHRRPGEGGAHRRPERRGGARRDAPPFPHRAARHQRVRHGLQYRPRLGGPVRRRDRQAGEVAAVRRDRRVARHAARRRRSPTTCAPRCARTAPPPTARCG